MKRAFTLVELLIVIIITGILATITVQIIYKVYENYYYARTLNKLSYKTDLVLNIIASKLSNRVKNSVIAVECNVTDGGCKNGDVKSFKPVSLVSSADAYKYPVLEWLEKDIYSKRGIYDENAHMVKPGWAGFVDLIDTQDLSNDKYKIYLPFSNFDTVKTIDSNLTASWGISGDVFDKKYEVLIFSGADDRGDFSEVNTSYGYYNGIAQNVFQILQPYTVDSNKTVATVAAVTPSGSTMVFEGYYLINTAMALVPEYNQKTKDYNLTLRMNYYPWNDQNYTDGNSSLIVSHVTQFRFREQNGIMRIYICIDDPKVKVNNESVSICKEKVVF